MNEVYLSAIRVSAQKDLNIARDERGFSITHTLMVVYTVLSCSLASTFCCARLMAIISTI